MKKTFILISLTSLVLSGSLFAQQKTDTKTESKAITSGDSVDAAEEASASTTGRRGSTPRKVWKRPYGMAGCGLGSMVMGRRGPQTSAGTTNGTSYNQTFGISSGTSNCIDGPAEQVAHQMDRFILVNNAAVAQDISRGNGETVRHLSAMMGCVDGSQLGSALQQNFGEIYPNEKVDAMTVTDSIISVIKSDSALAKQCGKVG
mgnify:CR=1 FL=1